ncbi:MAG TPA: hypothetical protein VHX15_16015 [Frankiaceae bacterium]|jgi:hypothetical protein|nr:hypothetical protein [Frankiaceae bacterium]
MEDHSHAGQGAVVLDIGGSVGALVVSMPRQMEGVEVEIRPHGQPLSTSAPHVAVVGRPTENGIAYTLVFSALLSGRYQLSERHGETVALMSEVQGGAVTFAHWPNTG